jgi:DNA replication protein DnaC
VAAAGFEEVVSLEQVTWETPVAFDRPRVRELFTLQWLPTHENLAFCGPVGVGKSFLACALGHSVCRAGTRVRFVKVARLLQALHQSRADNSFDRELRSWVATDVLIPDDWGLRKLTAQQSSAFYDVLVERHARASTMITSTRAVDEWVALFDDPILANSALARFAHRAHQTVMGGPSLRAEKAPGKQKGVAPPSRIR